jgi:hypothetical protein
MGAARRILAVVALVAGMTTGAAGLAQAAQGDEPTISADQQRDGWDSGEPGLSPAVVGGGTFGQLFSTPVSGQVYMGFSSYCDYQPYVGHVAGVNTATRALTMWTDESGTTDSQAGIWQSGGGLMSDGPGRIFAATGNGVSPAPGPGMSPPRELGDSVVRLGVQTGGSLAAQDFFSPVNAPALAAHDEDFGSGAPVALPFGTSAHPHLLMQAGRDGRIFLLDRDSLGGRGSKTDHPVYVTPTSEGNQQAHPAAFAGSGGADYLYYHGGNQSLRAFRFSTATGALTDAGQTPGVIFGASGSPVERRLALLERDTACHLAAWLTWRWNRRRSPMVHATVVSR